MSPRDERLPCFPGCGSSNHLQSITLSLAVPNRFFNLVGMGGTLQLKATGEFGKSKIKNLTNVVTWSVSPSAFIMKCSTCKRVFPVR
jgi:hypothetical protein